MNARARLLAAAVVATALLSAAVALTRAARGPASPPAATTLATQRVAPPARVAAVPGAAAAPEPSQLRDVFRYADQPQPLAAPREGPRAGPDPLAVASPAPEGPRLVGLVRRSGRLLAALAVDGAIRIAAPGESAGGITVLSVSDDGVRIRRADGTEARLELP